MAETLLHVVYFILSISMCAWKLGDQFYMIHFCTFETRQKLELSAVWRVGCLWRGKLEDISVFDEDQGEAQH